MTHDFTTEQVLTDTAMKLEQLESTLFALSGLDGVGELDKHQVNAVLVLCQRLAKDALVQLSGVIAPEGLHATAA